MIIIMTMISESLWKLLSPRKPSDSTLSASEAVPARRAPLRARYRLPAYLFCGMEPRLRNLHERGTLIYIYIYTHTITYIYIYVSLSIHIYIYIYLSIHIYIYIYICVYIYIYREREREREREIERERERYYAHTYMEGRELRDVPSLAHHVDLSVYNIVLYYIMLYHDII